MASRDVESIECLGGLLISILTQPIARGYIHAIIIHLDNGAIWNRHDFPEQTIIEIVPP
ncbi:MAG: hypothetical protein RID53_21935 [Coleofasciculus sp. B1-GNL1-01]|uniref:hypothetical protein n=1 Tax=Coleofasciculus sp. B1-GNL1-01 TaxID=3068484 RepID=UPI0032F5B8D2